MQTDPHRSWCDAKQSRGSCRFVAEQLDQHDSYALFVPQSRQGHPNICITLRFVRNVDFSCLSDLR